MQSMFRIDVALRLLRHTVKEELNDELHMKKDAGDCQFTASETAAAVISYTLVSWIHPHPAERHMLEKSMAEDRQIRITPASVHIILQDSQVWQNRQAGLGLLT